MKRKIGEIEVWKNRGMETATANDAGLPRRNFVSPRNDGERSSGFSLVELIMSLVIFTILMSISVPLYKSYVRDAKMAEGYALLSAIRDAQLHYFSEYGNFLAGSGGRLSSSSDYTSYDPILQVNGKTNKYFTWFSNCVGTYVDLDRRFVAQVQNPPELRKNGNYLKLSYDIYDGAFYSEA